MKRLIYIFIPIALLASKSSFEDKLINYHQSISNWVMSSSDNLDRYLSDINDTKHLSKTKLMLAYEFGTFSGGKISNNFDFALSLNLPRFKDKLKLDLEKVNKTTSLFDKSIESFLSKEDDNLDDSYNLALKFSRYKSKKTAISTTAGVRFNNMFLEPYVGLIAGHLITSSNKKNINIKNTLRCYFGGEIKDNISMQYLYNYSNDTLLGWYGNFDYSNKNRKQYLISEFIWHKVIDDYKFYRVGFIARGAFTNFKNPKKDSFEIYSKYHNRMLNKKWLFYEVTPTIEWENDNDFDTSVGIKFKVGATFGGS